MKVLDVKSLNTDIEQTVKDIHTIQIQLTDMQKAVRGITLLEIRSKEKQAKQSALFSMTYTSRF